MTTVGLKTTPIEQLSESTNTASLCKTVFMEFLKPIKKNNQICNAGADKIDRVSIRRLSTGVGYKPQTTRWDFQCFAHLMSDLSDSIYDGRIDFNTLTTSKSNVKMCHSVW